MKIKIGLVAFVALLGLSACDTPARAAARREVFKECMASANNVKESGFAIFNKGDDMIYACEDYARRNS